MTDMIRAVSTVDQMGRVTIPAEARRKLGLEPGTKVTITVSEDGVLIASRDAALKRIRKRLAEIIPSRVSLVDELLAERRREVARERP